MKNCLVCLLLLVGTLTAQAQDCKISLELTTDGLGINSYKLSKKIRKKLNAKGYRVVSKDKSELNLAVQEHNMDLASEKLNESMFVRIFDIQLKNSLTGKEINTVEGIRAKASVMSQAKATKDASLAVVDEVSHCE